MPCTMAGRRQQKSARSIFDELDADGSGSISVEELGVGLQLLGHDHITQTELHRLMLALDSDGSGTLEFAEFEAAAKQFLQDELATTRHVADLDYVLEGDEVVPEPIRKLRAADKKALVDAEWARVHRERAELDVWREEMTPAVEPVAPFDRTEEQAEEAARLPGERGIVVHEGNAEKFSDAREAAHAKAAALQVEGTGHMRARRYSAAAECFAAALKEGPTSVAYRDFLDPWKVAELERDLQRAQEMDAMGERASAIAKQLHLKGLSAKRAVASRGIPFHPEPEPEPEHRKHVEHREKSDWTPGMSRFAEAVTSGPRQKAVTHGAEEITEEFQRHFDAESALAEREKAHELAAQALKNYAELMKAGKYKHAAGVSLHNVAAVWVAFFSR